MNIAGRLCLLCALAAVPARAQVDFRLSGYAVNFQVYQHSNSLVSAFLGTKPDQFLNMTRLRLRPSLGLWTNAFLNIEYEVTATYFSSPLVFQPTPLQNRGQIVDLTWQPDVGRNHWAVAHFIDRLYVRHTSDDLDFSIGRQRISWGTGRIWNPTDLFNPINPTTFAKVEKDGVDAAAVKIIFGNFTDLSVVINPHREFQGTDFGIRFRTNTYGFDFALLGGAFDESFVFGGDFAGSVFDAGIRGEGIFSTPKNGSRPGYGKFILGVDNQFTEDWYALLEYHFNGPGASSVLEYDLQGLIQGAILNLGRRFIAIQSTYLLHPLLTLTGGYTNSITDGSGFILGSLSYSADERITISLGSQVFHGEMFDEFWYYPSSIYGRIDYFF
ncbi:MAG: hypothetical protein WEB37_04575 [Bacteroidota bacterium]